MRNETPAPQLIVVNKGERTVGLVDLLTGKQVAAVGSLGNKAHEVAISPDGRTAYAPIYGDSGVGQPGTNGSNLAIIDLASRKVTGNVDFGHGVRPHCAVFDAKHNLLYVTTELDNSVSIIDPRTQKIVGTVPTGQAESHMLAVSSDGSRGYTANVGPGTVSVLDMQNRKTIAVIYVARNVQRISISPDDKSVFTSDQTRPQLAIIDTSNNKLKTWVSLPAIGYGTAATRNGRWLLVAMPDADKVAVVDLGRMKVVRSVQVCGSPQEIIMRQDNMDTAYVSCASTNNIGVLNLSNWTMEKTIPVGKGPDGLAWANAQ